MQVSLVAKESQKARMNDEETRAGDRSEDDQMGGNDENGSVAEDGEPDADMD